MPSSSIGELFVVTNFGESHGPAVGCVIDGCPPGMELTVEDIARELRRRRPGTSRFVTQRKETDDVQILSGVYEGRTTGTPIALLIPNIDQKSRDYTDIAERFRPAHADWGYFAKFGIRDPRGGGARRRVLRLRLSRPVLLRKSGYLRTSGLRSGPV